VASRKLSVTPFIGCSAAREVLGYSGEDMRAAPANYAQTLVWTYVFGPFLAFLPARLRALWFSERYINWRHATIISGFVQLMVTPIILLLWTAIGISGLGASTGIGGGAGPIQTFYLLLVAMNPITWLVCYLILEGFFRMFSATLLDEAPGTLVLFAADKFHLFLSRKLAPPSVLVPDVATRDDSRADWQLKIESCRPKHEWHVGRLLRFEDRFYRITSCSEEGGARPFVFLLEAMAAGVPSRSVILYSVETPATRSLLFPQKI